MAVAAADFYTYARATGTPLPKSKQEEAQLAPAVDKWKKSRLVNNNQQENNVGLGEAAGLTAALAGIGASVVAARNPNVRRDLANLVRPGKATSTNVGGIKQDLNVKTDPPITDWENYKKSIDLKYPETNEPYIDPGRQSDLTESYRLQEGRKQADANLSVVSPEEVEEIVLKESAGEIPPGMQTPEQQAVVNEQDFINQAILKVQDDANAQAAAADYTRAELNALRGIDQERKNILNPRGYIESTGAIEPSLTDIAKIDDLSVSQQSLENTNLNLNANANAGLQIGLDPEITNTAKSSLTQADINAINTYDYQAGPMPPRIKPEDVTEQADGITSFNPWAADHEEISREQAVDFASGKVPGSTPYKDRDPVSGYLYTDIQDKLLQDAYDQKYPRIIPLDEPRNPKTSIVNRKNTLTQSDLNKMNQVGITGTRIAGPSNVQSIRNNQTLTRQGPVPEVEVPEQTFLKTQLEQRLDKLQQETTELKAIGQNLERAGSLMARGKGRVDRSGAVYTPGTTTFDNAMAGGMVARANIQPRITNEYYRKNISLPKTMRQAVDTESRDPGRMIDTEAKGGGGRKVTAYNPDYQQLSTVGPYGIERANYPKADITKRPTEMPISPRTGKPIQSFSTRPGSSPEVAKQSMEMSENIRKIYNSGRPDAQQLVEDYKRSLGWSPN